MPALIAGVGDANLSGSDLIGQAEKSAVRAGIGAKTFLSQEIYGHETADEKKRRRIMAFAIPVCVATWLVMAWKLPTLDRVTAPTAPVQTQTTEAV